MLNEVSKESSMSYTPLFVRFVGRGRSLGTFWTSLSLLSSRSVSTAPALGTASTSLSTSSEDEDELDSVRASDMIRLVIST